MFNPQIERFCVSDSQPCCSLQSLALPVGCVLPSADASNQQWGAFGEELACSILRADGWRTLARNWRCRAGEIDLLMSRDGVIAAVEVKLRRALHTGYPAEAVTATKMRRLRALMGMWLEEGLPAAVLDPPLRRYQIAAVRVDVVSILCPARGPIQVGHFPAVGWV